MKEVRIYTDGGCTFSGGGIGAYAAVLLCGDLEKRISGSFRNTTNNRMEIMAVIKALQALKQPCKITLYSDSMYVINIMRKRAYDKDRTLSKTIIRKNRDLWEMVKSLAIKHTINAIWIKGHSGDYYNETCDRMCKDRMKYPQHDIDYAYENGVNQTDGKILELF